MTALCRAACGTHVQAGMRAYLGKVCMDRNSKNYYVHSTDQNLQDTEAFVEHIRWYTDVSSNVDFRRGIALSCASVAETRVVS